MAKEIADGTFRLRQSADLQIGGRLDIDRRKYIFQANYLYWVQAPLGGALNPSQAQDYPEYNGCHDINQYRGFHVTMAITV